MFFIYVLVTYIDFYGDKYRRVGEFLGIVMILLMILYYVYLGLLAKRLGERWYVWLGLAFITNLIGILASYFLIRRLANNNETGRNG